MGSQVVLLYVKSVSLIYGGWTLDLCMQRSEARRDRLQRLNRRWWQLGDPAGLTIEKHDGHSGPVRGLQQSENHITAWSADARDLSIYELLQNVGKERDAWQVGHRTPDLRHICKRTQNVYFQSMVRSHLHTSFPQSIR